MSKVKVSMLYSVEREIEATPEQIKTLCEYQWGDDEFMGVLEELGDIGEKEMQIEAEKVGLEMSFSDIQDVYCEEMHKYLFQ